MSTRVKPEDDGGEGVRGEGPKMTRVGPDDDNSTFYGGGYFDCHTLNSMYLSVFIRFFVP